MHCENAPVAEAAQAGAHDENGTVQVDEEYTDNAATVDTSWTLEVVRAKYFFAGGSARFMFQFLVDELRKELDTNLGELASTGWQWFTHCQESVSPRTPSSLNTLMQRFKGKYSSQQVCSTLRL